MKTTPHFILNPESLNGRESKLVRSMTRAAAHVRCEWDALGIKRLHLYLKEREIRKVRFLPRQALRPVFQSAGLVERGDGRHAP